VTNGNASLAHATSQACTVHDGVADIEELQAAKSRTVPFATLRNVRPGGPDGHGTYLITEAETALIDALAGSGARPHACLLGRLARLKIRVAVEERPRRIPEYHLLRGTSGRADWPSGPDWPGLFRIDSLPLNFPAEALRGSLTPTAEGELCPPSCAGSASSRFGFCLR
jgi:hypothetical protein